MQKQKRRHSGAKNIDKEMRLLLNNFFENYPIADIVDLYVDWYDHGENPPEWFSAPSRLYREVFRTMQRALKDFSPFGTTGVKLTLTTVRDYSHD